MFPRTKGLELCDCKAPLSGQHNRQQYTGSNNRHYNFTMIFYNTGD